MDICNGSGTCVCSLQLSSKKLVSAVTIIDCLDIILLRSLKQLILFQVTAQLMISKT